MEECSICCEDSLISYECPSCRNSLCITCFSTHHIKNRNVECSYCKSYILSKNVKKQFNAKISSVFEALQKDKLLREYKTQVRIFRANGKTSKKKQVKLKRYRTLIDQFKQVEIFCPEILEHIEAIKEILGCVSCASSDEAPPSNKGLFPCIECDGIVTDDGKCSQCSAVYCVECGLRSVGIHGCDPDDRKSYQSVMFTTKPCPGCAVRIQRRFGCDQMCCTKCVTLFSWKTGKVLGTTIVHNPHALDMMKQGITINGSFPVGTTFQQLRNREAEFALRKFKSLRELVVSYVDSDYDNETLKNHLLRNKIIETYEEKKQQIYDRIIDHSRLDDTVIAQSNIMTEIEKLEDLNNEYGFRKNDDIMKLRKCC